MSVLNMMELDIVYDGISCYVYVLRCDSKVFYTGLTNNMARRIKEHRATNTGYTKKFKQKEIVFLYKLDNRKEARKVEVYIKSIGAVGFLKKYEKSLVSDTRTKIYNKNLLLTT